MIPTTTPEQDIDYWKKMGSPITQVEFCTRLVARNKELETKIQEMSEQHQEYRLRIRRELRELRKTL
jgi:hypothetical protein